MELSKDKFVMEPSATAMSLIARAEVSRSRSHSNERIAFARRIFENGNSIEINDNDDSHHRGVINRDARKRRSLYEKAQRWEEHMISQDNKPAFKILPWKEYTTENSFSRKTLSVPNLVRSRSDEPSFISEIYTTTSPNSSILEENSEITLSFPDEPGGTPSTGDEELSVHCSSMEDSAEVISMEEWSPPEEEEEKQNEGGRRRDCRESVPERDISFDDTENAEFQSKLRSLSEDEDMRKRFSREATAPDREIDEEETTSIGSAEDNASSMENFKEKLSLFGSGRPLILRSQSWHSSTPFSASKRSPPSLKERYANDSEESLPSLPSSGPPSLPEGRKPLVRPSFFISSSISSAGQSAKVETLPKMELPPPPTHLIKGKEEEGEGGSRCGEEEDSSEEEEESEGLSYECTVILNHQPRTRVKNKRMTENQENICIRSNSNSMPKRSRSASQYFYRRQYLSIIQEEEEHPGESRTGSVYRPNRESSSESSTSTVVRKSWTSEYSIDSVNSILSREGSLGGEGGGSFEEDFPPQKRVVSSKSLSHILECVLPPKNAPEETRSNEEEEEERALQRMKIRSPRL